MNQTAGREMRFGNGVVEVSHWGNVHFPSNEAARAARDAKAKSLRAAGLKTRCHVLAGQTRQWESFGVPDGTTGNVYKVTYQEVR